MDEYFADFETLPNGILVRRKIRWHECELESWPQDQPWLATIGIGGWHYSSRAGATKEQAINGLLEYMQDQKKSHQEQLEFQKKRLAELTEFLEKNDGKFYKLS
jgi:hypothetical protein